MASRRASLPDGRDRRTAGQAITRHARSQKPSARTRFGMVHGVVSISLEGRFVDLPLERLAREVDELVQTIAAGAERRLEAGA
ncbi:hypothetical protein REMIM1_CH01041 [Rhizobium etli bv. mimosae str. Mim1]|nr:hypothetical protein REMIM1_CH01041 [Rhizobium etli bv. mimosae str. Mim1]